MSGFIVAIQQLPAEKRQKLVVNKILNSSFAEKVEILKLWPLEETGEITQAMSDIFDCVRIGIGYFSRGGMPPQASR